MNVLDGLNDKQIEAVTIGDGPALVLAGAGTGKTLALVHRAAYLIANGVPPASIMAVTFTNKAAREMHERIRNLLGHEAKGIWCGTFHSICGRLMRQYHRYLPDGYTERFTILSDEDSMRAIKQTMSMASLSLDDLVKAISNYKTRLISAQTACMDADDEEAPISDSYDRYQTFLRLNNAMDFDDMIMLTAQMLQNNEHLRTALQNKFRYILVDEYQDINYAQYHLIRLLGGARNNVFAVGDDFQCLHENDIVQTNIGPKTVRDLKVGDDVQTIFNGAVGHSTVTAKSMPQRAKTIAITTASGHRTTVSRSHKMFASLPPFDGTWYVYLMWRPDRGYRLGITSGGLAGVIGSRTHSERPKKLWLLGRYSNAADAVFVESSLSLQYGVPTSPYFHNGRGLSMTQEHLDRLFHVYGNNGLHLLENLGLNFDYPNFVPQNTTKGKENVRNVNLYLGNKKGSCLVTFESNGVRARKQFSGQRAYVEANKYATHLCDEQGAVSVVEKLTTNDGYLSVIPASGLIIDMSIPVIIDNEIHLSEIVELEESEGIVYDIEVARTGIVVSDGVVSHNSIYGFRGSNISLILRFTQDYPDAQIIRLEQNYRSTKTIIDASNNVIVNNKYQMPKELWTSNITGDPVYVHNAFSDDREAMWVIDTIRTLISSYGYNAGDCAVLYRTNHQSRALEDVLLRYRMNYVLVGGISFYERMEIRDLLAYMKFVLNPQNSISLRRIVNIPRRGIGDVTLSKIDEYAIANGMTLGEAMRYVNDIPGLRKSAMAGAHEFVDLISGISPDTDPHTLLRTIIDRTGYMGYLDGQDDDGERKLNVYELLSVCESYREEHPDKSAYDFIEEISLMTDADRLKEGVDAVKLMTVHAAKGLEFPVVFVTGAEERLFPYARRRDNDVDIEEERRLFYVAMTRAKELLYITYADTRNVFGRRNEDCTVSRFAEEIPQELIALI